MSKTSFEENIRHSKLQSPERGYPYDLVERILTEVDFTNRKTTLQEKNKARLTTLHFVAQFNPLTNTLIYTLRIISVIWMQKYGIVNAISRT